MKLHQLEQEIEKKFGKDIEIIRNNHKIKDQFIEAISQHINEDESVRYIITYVLREIIN